MKNIFEPRQAAEIKGRLSLLRPDSLRQWGKMDPAQAMAHCADSMRIAIGEAKPPRLLIGSVLGWMIRPLVFRNDDPLKRNSPTVPSLVIADARDFGRERDRLQELVDRFIEGGTKGCTTHPHSFFGALTPNQWSILVYKHLDHHLRQFGV